jgi:predicted nucleic acid-binding protein
MRSKEEVATLLFLSQFKTAPVDQGLADAASAVYRKWHPSHGVDVNDAFLAAAAMLTGGKIYCLNLKHYPMPDIIVEKAWQE